VTVALWIAVGVVAWCALAVLAGLVIGAMLERMESQSPRPPVAARRSRRTPR
jgi:hypothetical protein